jgi:uncharacterized protein involved in exopolysaccharide biosynthesis
MSGAGTVVSPDGGELIDLGQGKLWLGFVVRSLRRHKKRALITFLTISALGAFFGLSAPKQYYAEAQLTAKSEIIGLSGVDPNLRQSNVPPAVQAKSDIIEIKNLEKIVTDLKLDEATNTGEGALARTKRKLFETIFGAPDPKQKRETVINDLRAALSVTLDDREQVKESIQVGILWSDPVQAKQILDEVAANWLANRKQVIVGGFQTSVNVLQEQVNEAQQVVEQKYFDLNINPNSTANLPAPLRDAQDALSRNTTALNQGKINLKTAETTYQLSNKIIRPAEVPAAPVSGNLKTVIAGMLAGLLLAAFVTAATDLSRGKVVEPWQVARGLNLPLLAELPK